MTIEGQMMPTGRTLAEATKNFKWIVENSSSDIVFRRTRSYQLLEEAVKIIEEWQKIAISQKHIFERMRNEHGDPSGLARFALQYHNPDEVEI